jgi:cystathionine beta-lyase
VARRDASATLRRVTSDACDFDVSDEQLRAAGSIKWTFAPADVIPAWVAELDVAPCPVVLSAVRDAVERGSLGYAPLDSVSGLPQATADFQRGRFGWDVDPSLVLGCGDVMAGVQLALTYLCEPAPVVVPVPSYPPFLAIVPLTGRELVTVPFTADAVGRPALDLDAIDAALAAGARTVLLSQPHNPMGRAFDTTELAALRGVVIRHGARVISDEIHGPLVLPGATHVPYASLPGTADHVTTVLAASKAWNIPGLKCAQIIAGNLVDAATLRGLPLVANHGISPLGIVATIAAYREGGPWLDSVVSHLASQRDLFAGLLAENVPEARWAGLGATYLAWVDLRATGIDDPAEAARRHGVEVSVGRDFGAGYERYARINIGTSAERLTRVMERLGRAWAARSGA